MAIINRVPKGFLGLLDAKTGGDTPRDTTGFLSPVVDLTRFYEFDIPLSDAQETQNGATIGEFARVTVPEGEAWIVYIVSASATSIAGGSSSWLSVRFGGDGVTQADLAFQTSATAAIGESVKTGVDFGGNGRLFSPGAFFACGQSNGILNTSFTTTVHFRRLQV